MSDDLSDKSKVWGIDVNALLSGSMLPVILVRETISCSLVAASAITLSLPCSNDFGGPNTRSSVMEYRDNSLITYQSLHLKVLELPLMS